MCKITELNDAAILTPLLIESLSAGTGLCDAVNSVSVSLIVSEIISHIWQSPVKSGSCVVSEFT
jgi:hypothetical protein